MRNTDPSPRTKGIVHTRSGDVCEHCHGRRAVQIHHRRPRGMGGTRRPDTNCAAALLDLCVHCHTMIESCRTWAYDCGLLIRQNADPVTEPVWLGGRWVLLDRERPLYIEPPADSVSRLPASTSTTE